jgi:hypothetical protein
MHQQHAITLFQAGLLSFWAPDAIACWVCSVRQAQPQGVLCWILLVRIKILVILVCRRGGEFALNNSSVGFSKVVALFVCSPTGRSYFINLEMFNAHILQVESP